MTYKTGDTAPAPSWLQGGYYYASESSTPRDFFHLDEWYGASDEKRAARELQGRANDGGRGFILWYYPLASKVVHVEKVLRPTRASRSTPRAQRSLFNPSEWMTKEEATKRAAAVARTVPGAKLEKHAHAIQTRSKSGRILIAFQHGNKRAGTDPQLWRRIIPAATVPNPGAGRGALRAVEITDRAKRYRARGVLEQLPAAHRERCIYCGGAATMAEHINGRESDNEPENIAPACRSCNNLKANTLKRAGLGKRTAQYNPDAKPAANLAQWTMAVASIRRRDKRTGRLLPPDQWKAQMMPVAEAVAMIRATSPAKRAEFARALASKRRPRQTSSSDEIPW